MGFDNRKGELAVPANFDQYLNEEQRAELRKIENFGWTLHFIRRPLFQEVTVAVASADGTVVGILEPDGRLNLEANISFR